MYFTSLLWATGWSGESEYCARTYVLVCSLVVMDNWTVNHSVFAVGTYFETKSVVQTQRRFRHEFDVPRHGRIPTCNAIIKRVHDFNVRGSVVNKSGGHARSVRTPAIVELVSSNAAESNELSKAARDRLRCQASPFEEFYMKTWGFIRSKFT
jgi:hypothetical protein